MHVMVNFFTTLGVGVGDALGVTEGVGVGDALGIAVGVGATGTGVASSMFPNSYFTRITGFEKVNPDISIA